MPEYLSPGVYVEEVDTGSKPIEGVSTSTSGMVGITERGPVGVPTLVTGFADFKRQFGGHLDRRIYRDTWYLPHAVEGFFNNGGKRLYIVRVLPDTAKSAEAFLFDRGTTTGVSTRLASSALREHTALLLESIANIDDEDWLRIDDEKFTEYVQADLPVLPSEPPDNRGIRALRAPLYFNHAAGASTPVQVFTMSPTPVPDDLSTTLDLDVSAGETRIRLTARANIDPGDILSIGVAGSLTREFAVVASVPADPADRSVILRHSLAFNHIGTGGSPEPVEIVEEDVAGASTQLNQYVNAGMAVLVLDDPGTDFNLGDIVHIGAADEDREYHVLADRRTPAVPPPPSMPGLSRIPVAFKLRNPAYTDHPVTESVRAVTLSDEGGFSPLSLQVNVRANSRVLTLVNRGNLAANQVISIGAGTTLEYLAIESVPTDALDTSIVLKQPLAFDHNAPDSIIRQSRVVGNATTLVQDIRRGEHLLFLADQSGYVAGTTILEIGAQNSAELEYQTLASLVDLGLIGIAGLSGMGTANGLTYDHAHGSGVLERAELLRVQAIDAGSWGNCLRLKVEDDNPILETTVKVTNPATGDTTLTLSSTVGIEIGSILEISFTTGPDTRKVVGIAGNVVTLSDSHGVLVDAGTRVRTREFRLTVECIQSNPLTGTPRALASEIHRQLSMDPRHSRYVTKVIGAIFRTEATTPPRADGHTDGESDLIRVEDFLADDTTGELSLSARAQAENTIRLGPDLILDTLPDRRRVTVGRWMMNGDDSVGDIAEITFVGVDDVNPRNRKGLHALKNVEEISIVAIPGRTSQTVQEALINHCELMRYRVAVLDSQVGNGIAEVQEHRGLYDTKYAALYYPWLKIPDPFPDNPRMPGEILIPPSGHTMGIYARSDIERGVHKAPANEVIRGIRDLEFKLMKEEQDILNPRNINVLRNFRENNRGLRVWGARVLSSDPDWKYVNVRRLFIFVEHSIDRGTQWVVFEPNNEMLWERVRKVVSAFLTLVWRDGALMGRTPEEAYFVKCDRTTMTQNDIDNGRLIVQIGLAAVKPAEFVIFRIGQWTGGSLLEEG